ncbi:MAG: class II aldolase/adducin family protein [Aggregatilineales bacterium]
MTVQENVNSDAILQTREHLAYIGRMMFERNLTDSAGGNISVRVGNLVVMSPSLAGQKRQWQINTEDVLVVDFERNVLVGDGLITRETNVHLALHQNFSDYGTAVIHSHARNLMVFAAMAKPMPAVLEANRKFGDTPVVEYAPAHSPKLGENIVASMRGREQRIAKHAAGSIAPWHGLFLMGKDLDAAFDAVERFDTNAYCIIMGQNLGASPAFEKEQAHMEEVIGGYSEE